VLTAAWVALAPPPGEVWPPADPRARIEHHLARVHDLADHFEAVLALDCPRFDDPLQWQRYVDAEIDRAVLLAAHLREASAEARRAGSHELRELARSARHRFRDGRALYRKLNACARANGGSLGLLALYRRMEADLPGRQAEIALPPPAAP
jgi:hypothetical protein